MAKLDIVTYGHPVLRRVADEITDFDESLEKFAKDMLETLHESDDGVGLAAPQVGVSKKFVVISMPDEEEKTRRVIFMVNPEIIEENDEVEYMDEGCLSLPGIWAQDIERATKVKVRYQELDGKTVEATFTEFLARVAQHETDHLDGVLMIDHLPALKRSLLRGRLRRLQQDTKKALKNA